MLVIRLSRVGKKNHPQFKVVVAEKSAPIKGRFVEQLGSYNPHMKTATLNKERIQHWLSNGALCTDTTYNLLVKEGVVEGKKRRVKIKAKKKQEEEKEGKGEESKKAAEGDVKEKVKKEAETDPALLKASPSVKTSSSAKTSEGKSEDKSEDKPKNKSKGADVKAEEKKEEKTDSTSPKASKDANAKKDEKE